jgi:6-phosphogluconolactonase
LAGRAYFLSGRAERPARRRSQQLQIREEIPVEPAGIPAAQAHRIVGELAPDEAARRYADDIRGFFALTESELPRFDVIHRGVGPDAHTASLFPGDPLIDDRAGIAAATFAAKFR